MGWPLGVARGGRRKEVSVEVNDGEPKDTNMAELTPDTAPETELPKEEVKKEENTRDQVTVDRSFMKEMFDKMHDMEMRLSEAEKSAKKGKGVETATMRLVAKADLREPDPEVAQKSIKVVDVPATMDSVMLHNECPYCEKFNKGLATIQDKTANGKFACRRCGKHWWPWALKPSETTLKKYPYSLALEQGDKKRVDYQERIQMSREGLAVGIIEGEDDGS